MCIFFFSNAASVAAILYFFYYKSKLMSLPLVGNRFFVNQRQNMHARVFAAWVECSFFTDAMLLGERQTGLVLVFSVLAWCVEPSSDRPVLQLIFSSTYSKLLSYAVLPSFLVSAQQFCPLPTLLCHLTL